MPLVSIIAPVYNVERFVAQCIESVIAQTFQDWEFILIDDGATDRSGIICDEYAAKDRRIKVVHKANTGLSDSRNLGLGMASADIISFIDSDDWMEPDMLEKMYRTLMDTGADIAVCGVFKDYPGKRTFKCPLKQDTMLTRDQALFLIMDDKRIYSYVWDKLYRKEMLVEKMPSRMYEDYSTTPKWFSHAKSVAICNVPLYHYRQRKGSIDHHVNPQRSVDFFRAEQERYKFLVDNDLLPEYQHYFRNKVLRIGVRMAKEASRCGRSTEELLKYVEPIRESVAAYLPADRRLLKSKNCRRLNILLKDPAKFIRRAIFTGNFKIESHPKMF